MADDLEENDAKPDGNEPKEVKEVGLSFGCIQGTDVTAQRSIPVVTWS